MTREEKKLAEASRRTSREVFRRARRELSPDTWREPDIVIDGVRRASRRRRLFAGRSRVSTRASPSRRRSATSRFAT